MHHPLLIFLSETKISSYVKFSRIAKHLKFPNFEFFPAEASIGGLALLWHETVNVRILLSNSNIIFALIFSHPSDQTWHFSGIYGPKPCQRRQFWTDLRHIANAFDGPWAVLGDFNTVLSQSDKRGGRPVASSNRGGRQGVISDSGLIDIGFNGSPFIWNNGRSGAANIQARLDRGFINGSWRLLFRDATLSHLSSFHSDHKPLVLSTSYVDIYRPRPFHFQAMWTMDISSIEIVKNAWASNSCGSPLFQLAVSLKNTKLALKSWNKNVFGSLQQSIAHTQATLETLQARPPSDLNLQKVKSLQLLLDTLLKEEIMWQEKWLEEGDSNSQYFHLSTIIRRRYNHISSIFDPPTGWKKDFDSIRGLFIQYFQNLFSTSSPSFPPLLDDLISSSSIDMDTNFLIAIPSANEIKNTVFTMANGKSPGPDGMFPTFFKH